MTTVFAYCPTAKDEQPDEQPDEKPEEQPEEDEPSTKKRKRSTTGKQRKTSAKKRKTVKGDTPDSDVSFLDTSLEDAHAVRTIRMLIKWHTCLTRRNTSLKRWENSLA